MPAPSPLDPPANQKSYPSDLPAHSPYLRAAAGRCANVLNRSQKFLPCYP